MRTKIFFTSLASLFFASIYAQNKTTVNAMSSDISDNLDLRAVASIFGDSKNLEDFEQKLNDPKNTISNLDLNNDNQVDYLRVIESVENNVHLIVIQDVLGKDQYQDVATVEVQKDNNNKVYTQVVGNEYLYGRNYIYEPVYVHVPIIYDWFWAPHYRPYYSSWYWGYYPSYYTYWSPYPMYRYRHHIGLFINFNHHYNYVSHRRCGVVYANYYGRRGNYYENQYPNRSFERRNTGYGNRYEMDQTRTRHDVAYGGNTRNFDNPRSAVSNSPRGGDINSGTRNDVSNPRESGNSGTRNFENNTPRNNDAANNTTGGTRNNEISSPRSYSTETNDNGGTRNYDNGSPRSVTTTSTPRSYGNNSSSPRNSGDSTPRSYESSSTPRSHGGGSPSYSTPRGGGNSIGGGTRSAGMSGGASHSGTTSSGGTRGSGSRR